MNEHDNLDTAARLLVKLERGLRKHIESTQKLSILKLSDCFFLYENNKLNDFYKLAQDKYKLSIENCNAIISLKLLQEFTADLPQSMSEESAATAIKFYQIGVYAGMSSTFVSGQLRKQLERFDRKSKPATKARRKSAITDVLKYLLEKYRGTNKIDDFMEYAQRLVRAGKNQDDYVAERVNSVKVGNAGYFKMQNGYGRSKSVTGNDSEIYPRHYIQNKVSKLRKEISTNKL